MIFQGKAEPKPVTGGWEVEREPEEQLVTGKRERDKVLGVGNAPRGNGGSLEKQSLVEWENAGGKLRKCFVWK